MALTKKKNEKDGTLYASVEGEKGGIPLVMLANTDGTPYNASGGGGGGGTSFDGQLTQDGSDVTVSNPLPTVLTIKNEFGDFVEVSNFRQLPVTDSALQEVTGNVGNIPEENRGLIVGGTGNVGYSFLPVNNEGGDADVRLIPVGGTDQLGKHKAFRFEGDRVKTNIGNTLGEFNESNPLIVSDVAVQQAIQTENQAYQGKGVVLMGANPFGNATVVKTDNFGNIRTEEQTQVQTSASGSISTSGNVEIVTINKGSAFFGVSGSWTGTIVIEGLIGATWYATSYVALASGNSASQFTANTAGQINVVGFDKVRLRGATLSSGTANVIFNVSGQVSNVMLDNPLPTGSNAIGSVSITSVTPVSGRIPVDGSGVTQPVSPRANTTGSGGSTPFRRISTADTNTAVIKASAGNLYSIVAINTNASSPRYLKIYNKATTPTLASDTPVMTIPIPANSQGAGLCLPFSMGVNFSSGIAIAITGAVGDTDTTAISANEVVVNLTYA